MAVNNTSNNNSRDGDTPDDLSHGSRTSGRKRRRRNIRSDKDVDDDGGEEVESSVDDLEESQSLGPILWLLELRDDSEEARVAREGDGNVGDSQESASEAELTSYHDASRANRSLMRNISNRDENSESNGHARCHGHITRVLQCTRQVQNPENRQAHNSPYNSTRRAIRQSVEANSPSEKMASHDKDLENNLRPTKNLLEDTAHADGFSNDFDSVAKVLDEGVLGAELSEDEAGVGGEEAHYENEDDSGHETDGGEDGGQGEDAEGYSLCDEDDTTLPGRSQY